VSVLSQQEIHNERISERFRREMAVMSGNGQFIRANLIGDLLDTVEHLYAQLVATEQRTGGKK